MKITKKLYDELSQLGSAMLNEKGQEINNPKPMLVDTYTGETMEQRIDRLLNTRMSMLAAEQGHETFEESQDFDVEDDFDTGFEDQYNTQYTILEDEYPQMEEELPPKTEEEDVPPSPEKGEESSDVEPKPEIPT